VALEVPGNKVVTQVRLLSVEFCNLLIFWS
jgi:hypothetical protein